MLTIAVPFPMVPVEPVLVIILWAGMPVLSGIAVTVVFPHKAGGAGGTVVQESGAVANTSVISLSTRHRQRHCR